MSSKYGQSETLIMDALRFSAFAKKTEATAYAIARSAGYTPRHVNRCLSRMWHEGKVAYRVSEGRNGKPCRLWTTIGRAKKKQGEGWTISEYAAQQMELPF